MGKRWLMLVVGLLAMIAGCAYQYGLPYLIPTLRAGGLSLRQVSLLISTPVAGLLVSLALWGAIADRWGERRALSIGLTVAGLALLAASRVHHAAPLGACLFVAGLGGASIHAASGRLILGWFAARERGLAMGVRQTGQPLGVGLAALTLPPLAAGHGLSTGIVFLAACSLVAALLVATLVRDPAAPARRATAPDGAPSTDADERLPGTDGAGRVPGTDGAGRVPGVSGADGAGCVPGADGAGCVSGADGGERVPGSPGADGGGRVSGAGGAERASGARGASPYRTPVLWRIHGASALLVVPQFAVSAFALVYLVDARGWAPATAGSTLALAQVGGAAARLAAGHWSDRVGSRLRPMRALATATGAVMVALTAGAASGDAATVALFAAAILTVSTNGLAYTAVAEYAGHSWAGRALGIQNTGQNLLATATPPLVGSLIAGPGFATAFGAVVALPVAAALLVPVRAERSTETC